jgi:hypothetical protein
MINPDFIAFYVTNATNERFHVYFCHYFRIVILQQLKNQHIISIVSVMNNVKEIWKNPREFSQGNRQ